MSNMSKRKKIWISIGAAFLALVLLAVFVYFSQAPWLLSAKKYVKYLVASDRISEEAETEGLGRILRTELYENNRPLSRTWLDFRADNKKVYVAEDRTRLVNYVAGYQLDLPADASFDFSMSPAYVTVATPDFEAVVSKERSSEDDMDYFINHYMHRFLLSETYRDANRITLLENRTAVYAGRDVQILSVRLDELPDDLMDGYTYVTVKLDERYFLRMMLKYHAENPRIAPYLDDALERFRTFEPFGAARFDVSYSLRSPERWSTETRSLYDKIRRSDTLRWGVYAPQIYETGIRETVPALEKKLNFQFPVVLAYLHFRVPFPTEFMQNLYDDGKLVELTFQTTVNNNEDMFAYTPTLDIYRGLLDDDIRDFARAAKAFGHPFLFRLNNEMNSDWTSYSGIINMSDPAIYIENWRRFYRIFQEEGVDNAIWVFNPNDHSYPPCGWNHYLSYYPGDEYVQMIGVTGYNTGTYYAEKTGETWRTFQEIYDGVQASYLPFFYDFPWIITEFASSSYGGDKAQWILDMFDRIGSYPNIKIAVWFSAADYDGDVPARPYFIDETAETTAAFRAGLAPYKPDQPWN